jgi:hypothetical protein
VRFKASKDSRIPQSAARNKCGRTDLILDQLLIASGGNRLVQQMYSGLTTGITSMLSQSLPSSRQYGMHTAFLGPTSACSSSPAVKTALICIFLKHRGLMPRAAARICSNCHIPNWQQISQCLGPHNSFEPFGEKRTGDFSPTVRGVLFSDVHLTLVTRSWVLISSLKAPFIYLHFRCPTRLFSSQLPFSLAKVLHCSPAGQGLPVSLFHSLPDLILRPLSANCGSPCVPDHHQGRPARSQPFATAALVSWSLN